MECSKRTLKETNKKIVFIYRGIGRVHSPCRANEVNDAIETRKNIS